MRWEKVKIHDCVGKVSTCNPVNVFKDRSFVYVDISSVDNKTKQIVNTQSVVGLEAPSRAKQLLESGDVLVSTVRPNLNAVATVPTELSGAVGSTGYCVLRPKRELLDRNYLFYWVRSKAFVDEMTKQATGASYPAVSDSIVKGSEIPLPPLPIQKQIADMLDKADALRRKDQELMQKYDELAQSIFYAMFGDPAHNNKGWAVRKLGELVSKEKYSLKRGPFGGALKKEIFKPSGYLVYEQYHAINDAYDLARYFVDKDKFEELEAFEVCPGDLIVSCSGVTLGRISEIPSGALPGIINQALLKVTLNQDLVLNDFFIFQFRGEFVQSKLFGFSRGSGIPNFPPMDEVRAIEFVVPPIDMQKKFSDIYRNIQHQKEKVSSTTSESMFQTLLTQSFN